MNKSQVFRFIYVSFDGQLVGVDVIANDPAVAVLRSLAKVLFRPVELIHSYTV